jgi:biotin operon repressor
MTSAELLSILSQHRGRATGISCEQLAAQAGVPQRHVRKLVSEMRFEGVVIVGTPSTGYYLATTQEELQEFDRFIHKRAMHSLTILSRLRKVGMPTLLGQLSLNQG